MNVEPYPEAAVSRIAAAIGDRARAQMLYCLADGHARTSTELAVVAGVNPSTASAHLNRLKRERLVRVHAQGKHRYYSLLGPNVAEVLEGLSVLAGGSHSQFVPNTPNRLRAARTCYDHIAGSLGVRLHDRLHQLGWLSAADHGASHAYDVTAPGAKALAGLGLELESIHELRRRFAYPCLDWSERRPHLGGALGAALLTLSLRKAWVVQELNSRALQVTRVGRREMLARVGLQV